MNSKPSCSDQVEAGLGEWQPRIDPDLNGGYLLAVQSEILRAPAAGLERNGGRVARRN